MNIRFIKPIVVDFYKRRLDETWEHNFNRWDEVDIEDSVDNKKTVDLITTEGDILLNVSKDTFELV